ncbi:MAG: nucleoside recognition family protein [Calditerrivibrio sp.]|nr:nucleoside recognition family protein [Calditerrivibrio sp.]
MIEIILKSGKTAVDLCLYVLLPVMVVMMAMMKILDEKRILTALSKLFYPILRPFGLPGLGIFAALQILLVSFAAPIATLSIMEKEKISEREIAASLAMVFTMSQANATFPLTVYGLNFSYILISSILGGVIASAITFYYFGRYLPFDTMHKDVKKEVSKKSMFDIVMEGGGEAVNLVFKSIPLILLAIFAVNILKEIHAIQILEKIFSPIMAVFGINSSTTLPIITKFLAGGTAMMAVSVDLIKSGIMTSKDLNLIAGFVINPFDIVGVMVLCSAGAVTRKVAKYSILGAAVGVFVKGILHYFIVLFFQ